MDPHLRHAIRNDPDLATFLKQHVNIFNAQDVLLLTVLEARNLNHDHLPLLEEAQTLGMELRREDVGPIPVVLPENRFELSVQGVREWVIRLSKNVRRLMETKEWLIRAIEKKKREGGESGEGEEGAK